VSGPHGVRELRTRFLLAEKDGPFVMHWALALGRRLIASASAWTSRRCLRSSRRCGALRHV
jgi:hypothetical protein